MPVRLSDHDFSHNTPSQRYIRLTVISDNKTLLSDAWTDNGERHKDTFRGV